MYIEQNCWAAPNGFSNNKKMTTNCSWCGKKIFHEKLYLIDSAFSSPKVFCSQKCKWEYEVQIRIESKKLRKTKNN